MKIRSRTKNWIFHRILVGTNLYFEFAKFEDTNFGWRSFYLEDKLKSCLTKKLQTMFKLWCEDSYARVIFHAAWKGSKCEVIRMIFFKGTGDSLVYFRKFLPENIFWVFFYSLFFEDVMLNYEAFCLSQVSAFSAPKKKCILANIFKWFQVHYKKL